MIYLRESSLAKYALRELALLEEEGKSLNDRVTELQVSNSEVANNLQEGANILKRIGIFFK